MRVLSWCLAVGGMVFCVAAARVGGPAVVGDQEAVAILGADTIYNAHCVNIDTCTEFNQALGVVENSDCAGGHLSTCSECSQNTTLYEGCMSYQGKNCELYPTGTECGEIMLGTCIGSECIGQNPMGDCLDAPSCTTEDP